MNKWWKIGCVSVFALIVLCAIVSALVYFFLKTREQPVTITSEKIPYKPALTVELITPNQDEQWPVNAFIPVRGVVKSESRVTAVELWIDGQLYGTREGLNDKSYSTATGEWYWQPAVQGKHTLFLRGADTNGLTEFSRTIQINAVQAVAARQLVIPDAGQTMADIASSQGVNLELLVENNPSYNPDQPLTPEESIFIPEPPAPVMDVEIQDIGPYIPPAPDEPDGVNKWINKLPGIGGLYKEITKSAEDSLPIAPTIIKAELQSGCTAYLEFKDNSSIEDGQRIFRSVPGQSGFSKVADLPPLITKPLVYSDIGLNRKGTWLYYAVSYNSVGESKSLPVSIELNDPACFPPESPPDVGGNALYERAPSPGKFTEDLIIISPEPVSLAYVYVTINDVTSRIPENSNNFFQEETVYEFDLTEYLLDKIQDLPAATEYRIKVQLWAWKGGKPVLIQEYEKIITDYTRLLACLETSPGSCDAPGAVWSTEVLIPAPPAIELKDVNIRFKMFTLKKSTGAFWQLTSATLYGEIYKVNAYDTSPAPPTWGETPAYFSDNWASLFNTSETGFSDDYDWETDTLPWTQPGFWRFHDSSKPFLVYYEVWPNYRNPDTTNMEYPAKSNRVYIYNELGKTAPEEQIPYAPSLPDIYNIDFLEETYTLPQFPIPERFGCITYLDNGQEQCPVPYVDPCADSMSWSCFKYTGVAFTDQYIDAYDWFAARYNEVTTVVSNELIDFIPGCRGTSPCEWIATKIVETAWSILMSELGLPERLPQTDELAEAGIRYVIEYYVGSAYDTVVNESGLLQWLQETGIDSVLAEILENYVSEQADEYMKKLVDSLADKFLDSLTNDPAVTCDTAIAHSQGYEPFCPDMNRPMLPAPGAQFVGPFIDVKITRKQPEENTNYGTDATAVTYLDANKYALKVTNITVNDYRVGQVVPLWFGYSETFTKEACDNSGCLAHPPGSPICYFGYGGQIGMYCYFEILNPLQGALYRDIEMPIPWLEPGKEVIVPLYFSQKTFWVPGKEFDIHELTDPQNWKRIYGDDWNYLYFYGKQNFEAQVACQSNVSEKIFCGASDEFAPVPAQP